MFMDYIILMSSESREAELPAPVPSWPTMILFR